MSQTIRLTKAAMLNGKAEVHYEYFEELGGELAMHPLTEGQFNQIATIKSAGQKMVGRPVMGADGEVDKARTGENLEMIIDLEKAASMEFEADVLAVMFSLSNKNETWTDREVKSLRPPGIIKIIAKRAMAISEVSPEQIEQVRSFRDGGRRPGDSDPTPDRDAAGKATSGPDPSANPIPPAGNPGGDEQDARRRQQNPPAEK